MNEKIDCPACDGQGYKEGLDLPREDEPYSRVWRRDCAICDGLGIVDPDELPEPEPAAPSGSAQSPAGREGGSQ